MNTPLSTPAKPETPIRRVAILFSGGPAPAANAVIASAAACFARSGIEVLGILNGYSHLIKTQIRVAAGETLPFKQQDVKTRGAAIECRINAEDTTKNFRPSPGTIHRIISPGGFGVRFDSHVHAGYTVSPYYDSMIGKLIVHQPTRQEAIACMQRALAELRIEGVKTTVPLQQEILDHPAFLEARVDTTFIERTWKT